MRTNLLAALACAACASIDRPAMSTFEPLDGGFRFHAVADAVYTLEGGERDRLAWMAEYNRETQTCPDGYEIKSRRVVRKPALLGAGSDVFYIATCL